MPPGTLTLTPPNTLVHAQVVAQAVALAAAALLSLSKIASTMASR